LRVHQNIIIMSNRIQNYVSILGFLIAFCSLGYSWYTRNQDKTNENFEKEAQYRAETAKDIQEVKEGCKSSLQAQKNRFQDHLLNNQKQIYQIKQEISLLKVEVNATKRQYEYLQSQIKLDNEALKKEIIKELKHGKD